MLFRNKFVSTHSSSPTPPGDSDLALEMIVDNQYPLVTRNVVFTITLDNNGPGTNDDVEVTALLPTGFTYVSSNTLDGTYTSGTGVWDIGSIDSGSDAELTVTATVKTSGTYQFDAAVTNAGVDDPNAANNTASVTIVPVAPKLWLKSDAGITESGGAISAWADQSGNGYSANQATALLKPSYVTNVKNSLPAVRFAADRLDVASFAFKSYYWAMIISNCTHPTDFFMEHGPSLASNDGFYIYGYGWFVTSVRRIAGSSAARTTTDGFMSGSANYTIIQYAGAAITVRKNAAAVSLQSDTATDAGNTTVTDTLYIGSRSSGALSTVGDVFEIILGEGTLSNNARTSLETYAATKWAI